MAHPPPKAPASPTLTAEQEREALDAAHKAKVDALERALDASLKGMNLPAGSPAVLILPVGPNDDGSHAAEVLKDVEAHYVAAGWSVTGVTGPDEHGRFTLSLVP